MIKNKEKLRKLIMNRAAEHREKRQQPAQVNTEETKKENSPKK